MLRILEPYQTSLLTIQDGEANVERLVTTFKDCVGVAPLGKLNSFQHCPDIECHRLNMKLKKLEQVCVVLGRLEGHSPVFTLWIK